MPALWKRRVPGNWLNTYYLFCILYLVNANAASPNLFSTVAILQWANHEKTAWLL